MPTLQQLDAFMTDEKLVELVERVKISDDVFDVIKLSETQHSDMLAWCLNPNEGHGQGDSVLKDFLIAAYEAGAESNRFLNAKFFERWNPSKIRTSSFGTAFIAREFNLRTEDISKHRRLDLFIVDMDNELVVTIENKQGAKLTSSQLADYYDRVHEQVGKRPVFKGFSFCYVVVDRDLEKYEEQKLKDLGNRWALLDYGWLKASANRARLHLERRNEAAQLLMAYCQSQTGWQSENERQVTELAAELTSQHEAVVENIREQLKVKPTAWTRSSFDGEVGALLSFVQQNRQLCEHLVQARGIGSVVVGLRKALPTLGHDDVEYARTTLDFATPGIQALMRNPEGNWPVYVHVYRNAAASFDDDATRFTLCFYWRSGNLAVAQNSDNGGDGLRARLAHRFPGLNKLVGRADRQRRIVLDRKLNAQEAVSRAVALTLELEQLIDEARRAGEIDR